MNCETNFEQKIQKKFILKENVKMHTKAFIRMSTNVLMRMKKRCLIKIECKIVNKFFQRGFTVLATDCSNYLMD